ncbi:MAG: energy transducer TonB, partial [bacterium]
MPDRRRKTVSYGLSGLVHFLLFLTFAVALQGPDAISDQVLPFLKVGLAEIDIGVKGPPSIQERRAPGEKGRIGKKKGGLALDATKATKTGEQEGKSEAEGSTPAINPSDHEAGVRNISGGLTSKTAQNFEFWGTVRLKVLLGADGAVKEVLVIESSGKKGVD